MCEFAWVKLDWEDLNTILQLVRAGTLGKAGGHLGVNYTTVARRVARAEKVLGQRLFERSPEGYRATEFGLLAAHHAEEMEASERALMRKMSGRDTRLTGPLVLTAPPLLVKLHLVHVIDAFCSQHPDVALCVDTARELVDLGRGGADLAIRVSRSPGDTLIGQRLTEQQRAVFACPELAQAVETNSLERVPWIVHRDAQEPLDRGGLGAVNYVRARFDDMVAMIGAAQVGVGVVRMPMFIGRATPGLVRVLPFPPEPYAPIWAVAHADVWPGAKVRALRELLVEYFEHHRRQFTAEVEDESSTGTADSVLAPSK